jgi:hypothetical protein
MSPIREPDTATANTADYTATTTASNDDVAVDDSTSAAADTVASLADGVYGLLRYPLRSAMQVASPY